MGKLMLEFQITVVVWNIEASNGLCSRTYQAHTLFQKDISKNQLV